MADITVTCLCPPDGSRHPEGEVVTFRDTLDFRTASIARKSIAWQKNEDPDADVPEVLAMLSEFFLLHCISSWTLRDAKGKAIEVNKANVREYVLPRDQIAFQLADFADDLYTERLLLPLAETAPSSSPPTPTNGSTSATKASGPRPTRSKPSSTESMPTAAIAPI